MKIRYNKISTDISDEIISGLEAFLAQHEPVMMGNAAPRAVMGAFKMRTAAGSAMRDEMICFDTVASMESCVETDKKSTKKLDDILHDVDDSFQESLLKLIDSKGLKDSDVYKKADIDRRLFSKIRSNKDYKPKKQTALSLALALGLNLDETIDLLKKAGYALSASSRADLIVRYCIEQGIYSLVEVNALLYKYDQPLLGGQLA